MAKPLMKWIHQFALTQVSVITALLLSGCLFPPPSSWARDPQIQLDADVIAAREACANVAEADKFNCLKNFAVETLNPNVCGLTSIFLDDWCLEPVWQASEDVSVCDRIYLTTLRPQCYAYFDTRLTAPPIPQSQAPLPPPTFPAYLSEWPTLRHESLGIEIRYPPGWQPVDNTTTFVRFTDHADEAFNVVNAAFPIDEITDFTQHIGPTIAATKTITVDGQPALLIYLEDTPEAAGYRSVVGLLTPDKRTLTVGNRRVEAELFEQIVTAMRFLAPSAHSYTGMQEIDIIVNALLEQDVATIVSHVRLIQMPCTTADGLGGPPKCEEDQVEGTVVEVFPIAGPHGIYLTPETIQALKPNVSELYAVYEVPAGTNLNIDWPIGEYGLIFRNADPVPAVITVFITEGKIVRLSNNFVESPEQALPESAVILYLSEEADPQ